MNSIRGVNMTGFFNRELLLYSLGDVKMSRPIPLVRIGYTIAAIIVWTVPIWLLIGFHLNPYFFAIAFVPPVAFGIFATKPIFGGKTLIRFAITMIRYSMEPRGWTDLRENRDMGRDQYTTHHTTWISRRRELQILADMKESRAAGATR